MNALRTILLALAALVWVLVVTGPGSSWAGSDGMPPDILRQKYPEPRIPFPDPRFPPADPSFHLHGAGLVRTHGCLECHRFGDQGARTGVDLSRVGRRLDAETIERLLRHPREVNPEATMPTPPLTRDEAFSIAAFLSRLR